MRPNKENIVSLLHNLTEAVKANGVEKVSELLEYSYSKKIKVQDKGVEFVINLVCEYYKISFSTVKDSKNKNIKRLKAMAFQVYLLNTYFGYTLDELVYLFARSKSQLSKLVHRWVKDEINETSTSTFEAMQYFELNIKSYNINNKIKN